MSDVLCEGQRVSDFVRASIHMPHNNCYFITIYYCSAAASVHICFTRLNLNVSVALQQLPAFGKLSVM